MASPNQGRHYLGVACRFVQSRRDHDPDDITNTTLTVLEARLKRRPPDWVADGRAPAGHDCVLRGRLREAPTALLTLIESPIAARPEKNSDRIVRRGFAVDPETTLQHRPLHRFQQLIREYGPVADAHSIYCTTPTLSRLPEPQSAAVFIQRLKLRDLDRVILGARA